MNIFMKGIEQVAEKNPDVLSNNKNKVFEASRPDLSSPVVKLGDKRLAET